MGLRSTSLSYKNKKLIRRPEDEQITVENTHPALVRLFIQRIEIGERAVKYSRSSAQSVKIIYRDVGNMDSPMEPDERQPHITSLPSIDEIVKMLA